MSLKISSFSYEKVLGCNSTFSFSMFDSLSISKEIISFLTDKAINRYLAPASILITSGCFCLDII
jgi:hypothetical protein